MKTFKINPSIKVEYTTPATVTFDEQAISRMQDEITEMLNKEHPDWREIQDPDTLHDLLWEYSHDVCMDYFYTGDGANVKFENEQKIVNYDLSLNLTLGHEEEKAK